MKKFKNLFLVIFSLLILSGIFSWDKLSVPNLYATPNLRQMAEHWSPAIYQSTEDRYDYITNFDFDGNWYGHDNWEHYDCYPLPAYVYHSIIESTDHYFITYSFFHPRDVGNPEWAYTWAHENDFEGCRVVIQKDGSEWGNFYRLETLHHHNLSIYGISVEFEGSHPIVYVTPYKHAVYGENLALSSWDCDYLGPGCEVFPSDSGTGVIYRYQGIAEEPLDENDRDVGYDLIDLKDTIWARRFGDPHRTYDYFIKNHIRLSPNSCGYIINKVQFGAKFDGTNYSTGATSCYVGPPWNKGFDNAGVWFIDPLHHYENAQGQSWACIGERYIYNPFRYSSNGYPPDCHEGILVLAGLQVIKSADKYYINEGESVIYTYRVYNAGKYPAKNINLTDNQLGSIGNKSVLEPYGWWTIQKTVTLNQTTTNQATATATYYYHCSEDNKTAKSNTVTVTVGEPPDDPDPDDPDEEEEQRPFIILEDYTEGSETLSPYIAFPDSYLPATEKIVWYWYNIHSFNEDEHSLTHWLKGMTANAHINENGHIEINVEPREFPNVLSSPDLKAFLQGKKFDAIRILYSNLIEYTKPRATGMIGWLDEAMIDEKGRLKPKDEIGKEGNFIIEFPLESGPNFNWQLIVLKDHPNWEKKANILGFTFTPVCQDPLAQGKFLIWAIELIKTD